MYRKQPSKSILLADYLSDNSKLHDIVVCTWVIIYLLELSVRLELTTVVYKTTVLPVKLRKHIQELHYFLVHFQKPFLLLVDR